MDACLLHSSAHNRDSVESIIRPELRMPAGMFENPGSRPEEQCTCCTLCVRSRRVDLRGFETVDPVGLGQA